MTRRRHAYGPGLCGLAATFAGVGIGRFAYVAILPLLVQQAWFNRTEAGYLGAANLAGYLAGIVLAAWLPRHMSAGWLMRACMLLCALSFAACAARGMGMPWFIAWRTLVGACGAVLMVLAPVLILPGTPQHARGRVGGVIFSGVGLGIVGASTVVPILMARDLAATWLALAGICALLTGLTWRYWMTPEPARPLLASQPAPPSRPMPAPVWLLLAAYTLNAIGYLPHTLFWADYIVAELRRPVADAAFFWACFGCGAACGPYLAGALADRIGFARTLAIAFALKGAGVALPLFDHGSAALIASAALVGFFSPGIVGTASAYTLEIAGVRNHQRYWTAMSFCFAVAQAGAAYAMVRFMIGRVSYRPLFVAASAALAISALCIVALAALRREKTPQYLRV